MVVTPEQNDKNTNPTDQWIWAERLFSGGAKEPLSNHLIRISDGIIAEIKPRTNADAQTGIPRFPVVAPGFIDIQINGAGGVMFNDTPDPGTIAQMARAASAGGSCHILPTFITAPGTAYEAALRAVAACNLVNILGVHLEGPFLSPASGHSSSRRHSQCGQSGCRSSGGPDNRRIQTTGQKIIAYGCTGGDRPCASGQAG